MGPQVQQDVPARIGEQPGSKQLLPCPARLEDRAGKTRKIDRRLADRIIGCG